MSLQHIKSDNSIDLTNIRHHANEQMDKETQNILSRLHNGDCEEETNHVVRAALNLRSLDDGIRLYELDNILFDLDGRGSRYSMLREISNPNKYTTVADDLSTLLDFLFYDIEDDGYLRLVRIKFTEPCNTTAESIHRFTAYRLTSKEWDSPKDAETRLLSRNSFGPWEVSIREMKAMWFKSLDEFASFLDILGDNGNYDKLYNEKMADKIDKLMHPENFRWWNE